MVKKVEPTSKPAIGAAGSAVGRTEQAGELSHGPERLIVLRAQDAIGSIRRWVMV